MGIILPFLFVFIYSLIAIRNVRDKNTKQIAKVKLRAPVPINNHFDDPMKHFRSQKSDSRYNKIHNVMDDEDESENDENKEIGMATVHDADRWDNIDRNQSVSTYDVAETPIEVELFRCLSKDKSTAL